MISPQRLDWLVGDRRPVRVIPARILEPETAGARNAARQGEHGPHKSLSHPDHQWEHAHDGQVHSKTLRHPQGIVEVHSASLAHLDRHLESVEISMRSRPPARPDAPQPVFVNRIVADAVLRVTGSPVAALAADRVSAETLLGGLLGAAAADI